MPHDHAFDAKPQSIYPSPCSFFTISSSVLASSSFASSRSRICSTNSSGELYPAAPAHFLMRSHKSLFSLIVDPNMFNSVLDGDAEALLEQERGQHGNHQEPYQPVDVKP